MLSNLLSAIAGGIITFVGTYVVQRRLEKKRRHEETLQELRHKADKIANMIDVAFNTPGLPPDKNVYPDEIHSEAREMEFIATRLNDEGLKRHILAALHKGYDSVEAVHTGMQEMRGALENKAFPVLHQVRDKYAQDGMPIDRRVMDWKGPASSNFIFKARAEGYPLAFEEKEFED